MRVIEEIFKLLPTAITALVIYLIVKKRITVKKYEKEYHDAINSGDVKMALNLGRRFYAKRNGSIFGIGNGRLRHIDETAISNDLKVMEQSK